MTKPYPKDNEPRTFGVDDAWLEAVALHVPTHGIGRDQPLFTTAAGTPVSRNTLRTRVWLPAVKASGVDFPVRMHDLRHAPASLLLAEGSDLKSVMERMGHAQIQTTQKYLHALPKPIARTSTPSPEHANGLNETVDIAGSLTQEAHMHHPDDEALIQEIGPVLELDHQHTRQLGSASCHPQPSEGVGCSKACFPSAPRRRRSVHVVGRWLVAGRWAARPRMAPRARRRPKTEINV